MGNIETVHVSVVVSMYLFVAVAAAYFESKLPVNMDFANNCQQCELDLDYVQFKCIVQVEKLVVKMTRQQSGLELDSGCNTPGDTNRLRQRSSVSSLLASLGPWSVRVIRCLPYPSLPLINLPISSSSF